MNNEQENHTRYCPCNRQDSPVPHRFFTFSNHVLLIEPADQDGVKRNRGESTTSYCDEGMIASEPPSPYFADVCDHDPECIVNDITIVSYLLFVIQSRWRIQYPCCLDSRHLCRTCPCLRMGKRSPSRDPHRRVSRHRQ